jgi:signal peptidase I
LPVLKVCPMSGKDMASLIVVAGDDMSPALKTGETLEVDAIPPNRIRVGDVIVFRRYVLIAHRVVGLLRFRSKYFFFTHGDKCAELDSPVYQKEFVGKVLGKSLPIRIRLRTKILFSCLLLWYLPISHMLNYPVVRSAHKTVLHVVSIFAL